jgi:high-affinity nickel-transport protein
MSTAPHISRTRSSYLWDRFVRIVLSDEAILLVRSGTVAKNRHVTEPRTQQIRIVAVLIGMHLLGVLLLASVLHAGGDIEEFAVIAGLGVTAYILGARHAFDADHILAIDNSARALHEIGRRPASVGFWFALGHSSVVVIACVLLILGVPAITAGIGGAGGDVDAMTSTFGTIGKTVSGVFLIVIAALNIVALVRRSSRDPRNVTTRPPGAIARRLSRITRPWQLYPVGLLFGLGFDTATEIGLLVLSVSAAVGGFPWYAVLGLPVLFAAGMAVLDWLDGVLMASVYRRTVGAAGRPHAVGVVVTVVSVVFALGVGAIQLGSVASSDALDSALATLPPVVPVTGFGIVALFLVIAVGIRVSRRGPAVPENQGVAP